MPVEKNTEICREPAAAESFTEREQEILREVVSGASNKVIAMRLNLSVDAIKYHLKKLMRKTGCATRTELAVMACRQGLVQKDQT